MFTALLLALVGFASPGTVADVQLEVLEGRVSLAASDGVFEVRAEQEPRLVRGAGYVEVPPLSRVSLRWRQAGSLLIEGPAAIEWSPKRDRIIWNFRQVGRTHMEIRSHLVRVYLPGGWIAAFENGASFLRERSGGSVEFHHDAGLPVLLSGPTKGGARPPWTILAGAKLLLRQTGGRPAALRGTQARMLEPYGRPESLARERHAAGTRWSGFSWPWRARSDEPVAAHAPTTGLVLDENQLLDTSLPPGRLADSTEDGAAVAEELELGPTPETGSTPAPEATPGATPAAESRPGIEGAEPEARAGVDPVTGLPAPAVPAEGSRAEENPEAVSGAPSPERQTDLEPSVPGASVDPWAEFKSRIRRDGQLILTPYGVRWEDTRPREPGAPSP